MIGDRFEKQKQPLFVNTNFSTRKQFPSVASFGVFEGALFCVRNRLHLTSVHLTFLQGSAPSFPGPIKVQFNSHFFLKSFPIVLALRTCSNIGISSILPRKSWMKSDLRLVHSRWLWGSHPAPPAYFLTCDKMVRPRLVTSHSAHKWGWHTTLSEGLCKWQRGPDITLTHVIHVCLSQVGPYLNATDMTAYKQKLIFPHFEDRSQHSPD